MFTSTVKATLSRIQNRHPPPRQPLPPPPPPNTMIPDSSPGRNLSCSFRPFVLLTCDPLPSEGVQDQVEENGQGDAQENAEEQSEKATSSHRLGAFRAVGHDPGTPSLGTTFVSKRTSSKTASR
jgi:hypothetical protein